MTEENKSEAAMGCPLCAFRAALKRSEAGRHLRGMEREFLLLARSLVGSCLRTAERYATGAEKTAAADNQP